MSLLYLTPPVRSRENLCFFLRPGVRLRHGKKETTAGRSGVLPQARREGWQDRWQCGREESRRINVTGGTRRPCEEGFRRRRHSSAEKVGLMYTQPGPVESEHIETEMRTASGIVDGRGRFIAGVVLITAGYSAEGKYSHYLIVQAPVEIEI